MIKVRHILSVYSVLVPMITTDPNDLLITFDITSLFIKIPYTTFRMENLSTLPFLCIIFPFRLIFSFKKIIVPDFWNAFSCFHLL